MKGSQEIMPAFPKLPMKIVAFLQMIREVDNCQGESIKE